MTKRMFIMLGAMLLLVVALAFGFYLNIQKMIASAPKPGPQTVSTIKAELLDWQPQLNAVGTLTPVKGVDLSTEVTGLVRSVNFHSGQEVKAGQVLVELNADVERAAVDAAKAAADLAEVVYKRDRAQLDIKAVSQAQVDVDQADLRGKRAQVAQLQAALDKKTIRAPFAGRLGVSTVMPGQYLNTGDKIVTLQNIQPIYVDFTLPQQQLAKVKAGQVVNLSVDAFAGKQFSGKVSAISPKVDTTTRNVQLEATVDNREHELLPGMFGSVSVNVGAKTRYLTVPLTAITYNPYGATAFIIKKADKPDAAGNQGLVAQQVFVTTGETRGDQVVVLKGLSEGQEVVSSGQIKLKTGTPVLIDNTVQPANSPNPKPQEH